MQQTATPFIDEKHISPQVISYSTGTLNKSFVKTSMLIRGNAETFPEIRCCDAVGNLAPHQVLPGTMNVIELFTIDNYSFNSTGERFLFYLRIQKNTINLLKNNVGTSGMRVIPLSIVEKNTT
jgi:hypothetical protein